MTEDKNKIVIHGREYVAIDSIKGAAPDVNIDGLPYVVVRSRDQGVMVGYLHDKTNDALTLLRARQVWSWKSRFILAEFAELGPAGEGRISCELSQPFEMANWCGVYMCTAVAGSAIRGLKSHEA